MAKATKKPSRGRPFKTADELAVQILVYRPAGEVKRVGGSADIVKARAKCREILAAYFDEQLGLPRK